MNPIPEYPAMSTFCYLCAHVNAIHERGVHSTHTPAQKRVTFISSLHPAPPLVVEHVPVPVALEVGVMDAVSVRSSSVRAAAQKRRRAVSCGPTDPMPPVCHRPTRGDGKTRTPPSTFARFLFVKLVSSGRASQVCEYLERRGNPYSARWAYSSISDECPSCAHFPRETWVAHYLASR